MNIMMKPTEEFRSPILWHFGEFLKKRLSELKMSQNAFALKSGISQGYASWVINGGTKDKKEPPSISVDVLVNISKAIEVSPSRLLAIYIGEDSEELGKLTDSTLEDLLKAAIHLEKIRRSEENLNQNP